MAVSVVQSKEGVSLTNGQTVVLPSSVTPGNLLVVHSLHSYFGCFTGIGATQCGTVTQRENGLQPSGGEFYHVFTAPITSAGTCTVTWNMACGLSRFAVVYEVSGHDSGTPWGGAAVSANSSSSSVVSGTITPTVNGSFVAAMFQDSAAGSYTPGAGFTERYDSAGYQAQDIIQGTAAGINPGATVSDSGSGVKGYAFFINAAAGSGAAFPFFLLGGSMSAVQIRRNEATASLRRWYFDIRDSAGAPWAGSVDGVKAKFSVTGGSETDSPADIVRIAGSWHYAEQAQTYLDLAEGSAITARVPAASGRLEATCLGQIIPADSYVPPVTQTGIVNAIVRAANGADGYGYEKDEANNEIKITIPGVGTITVPAVFASNSLPVSKVGA